MSASQNLEVDRLDHMVVDASLARPPPVALLAVPGDGDEEQALAVGSTPKPGRQLIAVHSRQADVEQHDPGPKFIDQIKSRYSVMNAFNLVPEAVEHATDALVGVDIVVDDHDPLGAGAGGRGEFRGALPAGAGIESRQPEDEFAAATAPLAGSRNDASVHLDERLDDRQSDAEPPLRPIDRGVGLSEEIEDPAERLGRNPDALVDDADDHVVVLAVPDDGDRPPFLAVFGGVAHEVDDDLLQPRGSALTWSGSAGRRRSRVCRCL